MKIPKVVVYVLLLVFGMGVFTYLDYKHTGMLYDDAYSIFMIKASFADIANITASDVHPPLYYWGLKAFSLVFGESIFTLRLFSALGVLATLLLGCFPVRRFFGDRVAISFIVLLILFPVTQYVATDIRMYSWTMFFVLAAALCAYQVFTKGKFRDWVLFFITGLCAAYLHNYGLLSVLGLYIILLIAQIKEKKKYYPVIICGLLFSLAYLPWLLQLMMQVENVAHDYWIKPLTINDLFLHIYYFYSPKEIWLPFTDFSKTEMMVGLILLMVIQLILTWKVLISNEGKKEKSTWLVIIPFFVFLIPITIGAIISVIYLPILVTRYMTCSFGLYALSLAFVIAKVYEYPTFRYLSYVFLLFLFLDGGVRFYSDTKYYSQTEIANQQIHTFVKDGAPLVVNDFSYHVIPRLQLIVPVNRYYVLTSAENKEDFRPFHFNEIDVDKFSMDNFILVHQEREAIQDYFRKYQSSLKDYIVTDSIHAVDIYLYKMKRREE